MGRYEDESEQRWDEAHFRTWRPNGGRVEQGPDDGDERLPDGTTLAANVGEARRRAQSVPGRHVAARYREYGWGNSERWAQAVDGRDEPTRPAQAEREQPDERREGFLRAQPTHRITLSSGDVCVLGEPGRVEFFPRPGCVECGRPVPWGLVPVTIGLDATPDGGRVGAYCFRGSVAIHARCRRRQERQDALDAVRAAGPIVRTFVEEIGPPTLRIGQSLVAAVAPVVTSPIRDGWTTARRGWCVARRLAAERRRSWTRQTSGGGE
jgi:hypothetical protein